MKKIWLTVWLLVLLTSCVAAQTTADVAVHWRGNDTVRIAIHNQELVYAPRAIRNLQLPASDRLLVKVISRTGTHMADKYLAVLPGKGDIHLTLEDNHVQMKYYSGPRLKNCLTEIAEDMLLVQGSSFEMGNALGADNEKPVHAVRLKSFYLSKYEVTNQQWKTIMGHDTGYFRACYECPVENITWENAQRFIARLNELSGKKYRLPTEAEWEYAARGGAESANNQYSGSNTLNDVAWCAVNSNKQTHPVGTKMPNEIGLYDMTGNVWEWCSDWYGETYYQSARLDNPKGPDTGEVHVLRGGSWFDFDIECRTTFRFLPLADYRMYNLGFRLAMDVE